MFGLQISPFWEGKKRFKCFSSTKKSRLRKCLDVQKRTSLITKHQFPLRVLPYYSLYVPQLLPINIDTKEMLKEISVLCCFLKKENPVSSFNRQIPFKRQNKRLQLCLPSTGIGYFVQNVFQISHLPRFSFAASSIGSVLEPVDN